MVLKEEEKIIKIRKPTKVGINCQNLVNMQNIFTFHFCAKCKSTNLQNFDSLKSGSGRLAEREDLYVFMCSQIYQSNLAFNPGLT